MVEVYESLGFKQHPFTKYSAEEEADYLSEIFIHPRYFTSLLNDLKTGASRFILGERGSGKSALIFELHKKLSEQKIFSVIVDNYDNIPLIDNDRHLLYLIIRNTLKSYVAHIFKNKLLVKKLNKNDKEILAIIVRDFFSSISKRQFEDIYNKVTKYKTRNFFKNLYNNLFHKPINWTISVGLEIGSDFVCKTLNLPKNPSESFYKTYLPAIPLETLPDKQKEEALLSSYDLLKDIFINLNEIIKKSGFSSSVIFLDKIDEFKRLEGKIDKIVNFTEQILKDTSLLYFNNISIVFSIWTEVKIELNSRGVRFDKFKPIDINWTDEEIKKILEQRLIFFSKTGTMNLSNLFENINELEELIKLANKSPRDLIRLFSIIFDEQSSSNISAKKISNNVLIPSKTNFCKSYDYYSVFPSKRGTKEDIVSIVNRILRVGRVNFKSTDVAGEFKFGSQSANNYIKIYKNYGLIKDNDNINSGPKDFFVTDPKLKYLIKKGIKSIN